MAETGKKVTIWNRTFVCCVLAQMFFVFSHQFTSSARQVFWYRYFGSELSQWLQTLNERFSEMLPSKSE